MPPIPSPPPTSTISIHTQIPRIPHPLHNRPHDAYIPDPPFPPHRLDDLQDLNPSLVALDLARHDEQRPGRRAHPDGVEKRQGLGDEGSQDGGGRGRVQDGAVEVDQGGEAVEFGREGDAGGVYGTGLGVES